MTMRPFPGLVDGKLIYGYEFDENMNPKPVGRERAIELCEAEERRSEENRRQYVRTLRAINEAEEEWREGIWRPVYRGLYVVITLLLAALALTIFAGCSMEPITEEEPSPLCALQGTGPSRTWVLVLEIEATTCLTAKNAAPQVRLEVTQRFGPPRIRLDEATLRCVPPWIQLDQDDCHSSVVDQCLALDGSEVDTRYTLAMTQGDTLEGVLEVERYEGDRLCSTHYSIEGRRL